jgi:hypothetical protein
MNECLALLLEKPTPGKDHAMKLFGEILQTNVG